MKLFDTHCHLQDKRLSKVRDNIVKNALEKSIKYFSCCGTQEEDWDGVEALSKTEDSIIPSFGIHPWFVEQASPSWLESLEQKLKDIPSGVGETGLDFALKNYSAEKQISFFTQQLKLAKKYNRPLSIHCRKAWGALLDILKDEGYFPAGGIIHSFSGSSELSSILPKHGFSLSFSGAIVNHKNKRGRTALNATDLKHITLETDSPDQLPCTIHASYNEPAFLHTVLDTVSQLRGIPANDIAHATFNNSYSIYKSIIEEM